MIGLLLREARILRKMLVLQPSVSFVLLDFASLVLTEFALIVEQFVLCCRTECEQFPLTKVPV